MQQTQQFQIPSDPKSRAAIKNAIIEASDSKLRIQAENDLIKDIRQRMKEEHEMPGPIFNKLVNAHFKQNAQEEQEKIETVVDTYSVLFQK